jgi:diaminopimelate decarboxylase
MKINKNDVITVHSRGSYGLTASPIHFISHSLAREIFIDADGIRDVTRFHSGW